MALKRVVAADAIAQLASFDAVIDARSESEFAQDHLPGAVNWPVLNDAERAAIGSDYKQASPFEARKRGAVLAARHIARYVEERLMDMPRGWRPLIYCWRGGQRSGSLALVLDQIGFTVAVLDGGYREFRRAVLADLQNPPALKFCVLLGRTGSAKSRLLQTLATQGAQVLDLEALANHRGSVLGLVPGEQQPSQKAFETQLWQALRGLDPTRVVYVEGESRTIGRLRLSEPLLQHMRASACVQLEMTVAARVEFLLHDYAHFVTDVASFCQRLDNLRELRGNDTVTQWQAQAHAGQIDTVVQDLLEQHYDPIYVKSMQRNFASFAQAPVVALQDASAGSLHAAAKVLMAADG